MPLISVIDDCYTELERLKADLIKQKKSKGQPAKTTFSEVVCMLIRERKGKGVK
jgi:predicted CopG family antitoxin